MGTMIYGLLIGLVALWNPKAKKWKDGRKNLISRIQGEVKHDSPIVWVHCASLGEFEQGRPIVDSIKKKYPNYKIVLTFFSPSGYEVRKNYPNADYVYYLPLDTPRNAKLFVEAIAPEKVFFIKYDYWYNYLHELNRRNIPTYFVSAIFRPTQLFFKSIGIWYRKMLNLVDHFFVQNEESRNLLASIGIDAVTVSGDTRFDRVAQVVEMAEKLELVEKFADGEKLFVAGSTWQPDEELIDAYIHRHPSQKWIVAPHEVLPQNIERLELMWGDKMIKYGDLKKGQSIAGKTILLIDCYGILTSLYQYGSLAYIGGGFGVGIHNTLEAATFGMPILFGPNYLRFKEAVDMVRLGVAFPVDSSETFTSTVEKLISKDDKMLECAKETANYVQQNTGASDLILSHVFVPQG